MSDTERDRLEGQTRGLRHLARGLLLIPLTPILLAFCLPIASVESGGGESVPVTLRWLVAEFGSMRSATGVRPVVLVLIVGLITLFVGCCAVAVGSLAEARWAVVIDVAAVVVVLAALVLPLVLGAADHVSNGGFEVHAQGWAFALLASGLSFATVRLKRDLDDQL
ncbi:MAG TPA: hypothetical protein VK611_09585 [Acidimicrobiales bacterium]|nr:hypothetical protein [Acidimicrobiales bacterium]